MLCMPGKRGEQGRAVTLPGGFSGAMHGGIHGASRDR